MFSDKPGESVNFCSTWKGKRELKDSEIQTDQIIVVSKESQHPIEASISVQTEESIWTEKTPDYNVFVLLAFLQRVEQNVIVQLESNLNSRAFQHYNLIGDLYSQDTRILNEFRNPTWASHFQCTAITWSPLAPVLAVGYGADNHESWCDHEPGVALWNLDREILNRQSPQNVLESDGCITALSFHPKTPSCLAVGKVTGEIFIFNTAPDEESNIASNKDTLTGHREPITALTWIPDPNNSKQFLLMSCSLDGKILLWNYFEQKLTVVDGFVLLAQHLPRSVSVKNPNAEIGVTCLSVNSEDPSIFVVGTESGALFQCSLHSQSTTHLQLSNTISLKNPIGITFALHNGYVQSVHFSPHTRNVFLSCDSIGEIRISTLLQPQPVLSVQLGENLSCAQWSPTCPLVFGITSMEGKLNLFDLSIEQTGPYATFQLGNKASQSATSLSFNSIKTNILATASSNGCAQVWRLESRITSPRTGELETLISLGIPQRE